MIVPDPGIAPACHAAAALPMGDGWLAAAGVLLAGLLGTIMPCTVQMAVVLSSILASPGGPAAGPAEGGGVMRAREAPRAAPLQWSARVGAFLAGYLLTFLAAAGAAALLVRAAGWAVGGAWLQVAGGLTLAAFGLQIMGRLRLPGGGRCGGPVGFFLTRPYRSAPRPGRMGAAFALYCAGCCGPAALGSALLLTGAGSAAAAGLLLMVYALGMAIPFALLAAGLAFALRTLRIALRHAPVVSFAGGAVAVIAGAVLALKPLAHLIAPA